MVQRRTAHVNNSVHSSFLVVRVFPLWLLEIFKNAFWIEWIESCIRPARLNIPRVDCDSARTAVQIRKALLTNCVCASTGTNSQLVPDMLFSKDRICLHRRVGGDERCGMEGA